MSRHLKVTMLIAAMMVLLATASNPVRAVDARAAGLKGDGITDDTAALQTAMGAGNTEVVFPKGIYLLGTVRVPANVTLRGEAGAIIRIHAGVLQPYDANSPAGRNNPRCVFALVGNDVRIDGFTFDFTLTDHDTVKAEDRPDSIITAEKIANITLSRLVAIRSQVVPPLPVDQRASRGVGGSRFPRGIPAAKSAFNLSSFKYCDNILVEHCRAQFMQCMASFYMSRRMTVRNNWATDCYAITKCQDGCEYLHHTDNWSRCVTHQCRWWGGNANDKRKLKPESEGWGTATTVKRDVPDDDSQYNRYTSGEFDILVAHNYAEYGTTLAWGAKGRQIIFQGNVGRFFGDYGLGSEGGENIIYDGNIIINGMSGCLTTMYWAQKLVMTGNILMTRDEPIKMEYSSFSTPKAYQGPLIRLHYAGSSSGSGAGQVLISGNVLSCEVPDMIRGIRIQSGRDVQITGNKLLNANISKYGDGSLFITDNTFTMTTSNSGSWINTPAETREVVIRGNIFQNTVPMDRRSPTEMLILAEAGFKRQGASAMRVIENNQAEGFPMAVWARTFAANAPSRLLIRNNQFDGAIRVEGLGDTRRLRITDNLDVNTLLPMSPVILNQEPQKRPDAVPAPAQPVEDATDATEEQRDQSSEDVQ